MSTALAAPAPKHELIAFVQSDKIQAQLAMALPRYYSPEQFTVIVRTAINKNPKLAECDPTSFLTSLLTAAQMGILPNGRDGHLIPRWNGKNQRNECTFLADYKGTVGLIRRNDDVADVYAVNVCKQDLFKITQGLHRDIIHEPDYTKDRGEIIGVYAVILYKSGLATWEFLSRSEVESIRERSESWKAHKSKGYDTPWKADEGEMFKKTALKRVSKLANLSPDTMERLMADSEIRFEKDASVTEIKPAKIPAAPALENRTTEEDPAQSEQQEEHTEQQEETVQEAEAPAEAQHEKAAPKAEKKVEGKVVEKPAEKPANKLLAKKKEPAAAEVDPKLTEIRTRLANENWTEDQLNAVLVEFKVLDEGETVAAASDNKLNAILEYWVEVAEELGSKGGAK